MMSQSIDLNGRGLTPNRRQALGLLGAAVSLGASVIPSAVRAEGEDILSEALVLRDPGIPAVGNSAGDITIVEWFDFQCPYCRKLEPELRQVVHDDGKVKLIWK